MVRPEGLELIQFVGAVFVPVPFQFRYQLKQQADSVGFLCWGGGGGELQRC